MKLFYRKYGETGIPVFILHGLFGQCDNWQTIAKTLAEKGHEIYIVDQRNHGLSPHSEAFNYQLMSSDLYELIHDLGFQKVILLGHSMGGKTALQFVVDYPGLLSRLFVADISAKYYAPHHQQIIFALEAVDLKKAKRRKDVEEVLSNHIPEQATRAFLMKNIYWKTDTQLEWRFNLEGIVKNIGEVGRKIEIEKTYSKKDFETLFIRGEKSNYIPDADIPVIREHFPDADIVTITGAGHWLHADKPKEFVELIHHYLTTAI
jgi:esterase